MAQNWFSGTEATHFAGLPVTEGKWVVDRDCGGTLHGRVEMFWSEALGRWVSIPDASRYVSTTR
jgi:hypothetical protein